MRRPTAAWSALSNLPSIDMTPIVLAFQAGLRAGVSYNEGRAFLVIATVRTLEYLLTLSCGDFMAINLNCSCGRASRWTTALPGTGKVFPVWCDVHCPFGITAFDSAPQSLFFRSVAVTDRPGRACHRRFRPHQGGTGQSTTKQPSVCQFANCRCQDWVGPSSVGGRWNCGDVPRCSRVPRRSPILLLRVFYHRRSPFLCGRVSVQE